MLSCCQPLFQEVEEENWMALQVELLEHGQKPVHVRRNGIVMQKVRGQSIAQASYLTSLGLL